MSNCRVGIAYAHAVTVSAYAIRPHIISNNLFLIRMIDKS